MIRRRLAAALAAAALVATSAGSAAASTKAPTRHPATVRPTKPAASTTTASTTTASTTTASTTGAPAAACGQEIADGAQVMSGDELDALDQDAADLAGRTTLRIRTVASVPGGNLNDDEKALQIRCGWADGANVRQPRLLVLMVATQDRQMGIYPGPDLVATITDPAWLSIEQDQMRPLLAEGDWSGGLQAGVDALDGLLSGAADATEPSADPTQSSPLQYDANGNLIQGDGSAEHPFITGQNGVLPGSKDTTSDGAGLVIAIGVGLVVIGIIAGTVARSGRKRQGRFDPTTGLWDSSFGQHQNGTHHRGGMFGGGGGFDGGMGSGGGGSSSDGGGGSSGF